MAQTGGGPAGAGSGVGPAGAAKAAGSPVRGDGAAAPSRSGVIGTGGSVGLGAGDPDSQRVYDEAVARGALPAPKGPKPLLSPAADPAGAPGADMAGRVGTWQGEPHRSPRTGPATLEDAWKWEGVPPGRGLIGPVEPGRIRHYMDDDGHGPCIRWLPPAWPPGERPGDGEGRAG